jgi:N-acetylneuraminic acid mutarotase
MEMSHRAWVGGIAGVAASLFALVGCGSDPTYTVGGTIAGLDASGLALANGGDTVSPPSGATTFSFPTALAAGAGYAVTVKTQPAGETCTVAGASGSVGSSNVTGVQVVCTTNVYSLGGHISGLTGPGLKLTNGSDVLTPAVGATTFTFSQAIASGTNYSVSIAAQPAGESCQLTNGTGTVASMAISNIVVSCGGPGWTWVGGPTTAAAKGVYGHQGVASGANAPGARYGSALSTDASGNVWLFGGDGDDSGGAFGVLNDLWEYQPATGQWTWLTGSQYRLMAGVYGTRGTAAAANVPGARYGAAHWMDKTGALWVLGGDGVDSTGAVGLLNDLWKYTPATGQWTWVAGSNLANASGVYGIQGSAGASNIPGARYRPAVALDQAGNVWLFGGQGVDSTGAQGYLNDLWRYAQGAGEWTWVAGANTANGLGVYDTGNIGGAGNFPGARYDAVAWIDAGGDFRLFGGYGLDSAGNPGWLNDFFQYELGVAHWSWISGSPTADAAGVFTTLGEPGDHLVTPGAREGAVSWSDAAGRLWLFGGTGRDSTMFTNGNPYLNDTWQFDPSIGSNGDWTWMSGSMVARAASTYGTQGTVSPANTPGARDLAAGSIDPFGNLWLFGGNGLDSNGAEGELGELWRHF